MQLYNFNCQECVNYALKWAKGRNPKYYDFENLGGDCTNFASQSVYAGCGVMNVNYPLGWYYYNSFNRSPSWTSVEYFYNFLFRKEKSIGPVGKLTNLNELELGDLVQVKINGIYTHTLVITKIESRKSAFDYFVCAHTYDALNRRLSTYNLKDARFIKILGFYK
ncbi:MAG: amidase domain-containing protein [Firmicutes bacterium]|nr:amidase domain-containing protein [Bacillota bacterium]